MLLFMKGLLNINFSGISAMVTGLDFTMPNLELIKLLKNMLQYYNI